MSFAVASVYKQDEVSLAYFFFFAEIVTYSAFLKNALRGFCFKEIPQMVERCLIVDCKFLEGGKRGKALEESCFQIVLEFGFKRCCFRDFFYVGKRGKFSPVESLVRVGFDEAFLFELCISLDDGAY